MAKNLDKLAEQGRIVVLPVPLGTTVYRVIPRCNAGITYCPFAGGYGTRRCGKGEERCGAYVEAVPYSIEMYKDKSVYVKRINAERKAAELNGKEC